MNIDEPLQLLGGMSPGQFMRRHWQKRPLLIRQAIPGFTGALQPAELFALAALEDVESRLVVGPAGPSQWKLRHGPFTRRALPALARPGWTLLVQGVDLHMDPAHDLLQRFRFVPDARLDDLMVSYASDAGGVGPHFDSYDVFLLQARGRRRWRIGRQKDLSLVPNAPLKILSHFEPEQQFDLDPGDMLYLPPRYAHDGLALGPCMTYSVGFKAPRRGALAADLLQRLAEGVEEELGDAMYADLRQSAVAEPAAIPGALNAFARAALNRVLRQPAAIDQVLGELLTEPKAEVWFDAARHDLPASGLRLDRRTRMMYDTRHVFVNGESFRSSGIDARLMRMLADQRRLGVQELARASAQARMLLKGWYQAGWIHGG